MSRTPRQNQLLGLLSEQCWRYSANHSITGVVGAKFREGLARRERGNCAELKDSVNTAPVLRAPAVLTGAVNAGNLLLDRRARGV